MLNKLRLPIIKKVILKNFSIFSKAPYISTDISNGVFCLAGANGLGKSTFLLAINFGITGIVPEPSRRFLSMEKYYNDSIQYSSKFFNGRITEKDRQLAEVTLEMMVGKFKYVITRGLFEPKALRQLVIFNDNSQTGDFQKLNPTELHDQYTKLISEHVGLESFVQLVFLQHFVLTFDERRDLLFWNERVLERSLYLAFGVSPEEAKQADNLRKEYEDADSNVRNYNWEATQLRNKIQELESQRDTYQTTASATCTDIKEKHHQLNDALDKESKEIDVLESELSDTDLKITNLSARQSFLRHEYETIFSTYITGASILHHHPIIVNSIKDSKCGLCGAEGEEVVKAIKSISSSENCPLCGSAIEQNEKDREQAFVKLHEVDALLLEHKSQLEQMHLLRARLDDELVQTRSIYKNALLELKEFEVTNKDILDKYKGRSNDNIELDVILQRYIEQMNAAFQKKENAAKRRERKSRDLKELQKRLERQYARAEQDFVPKFMYLATSFLGLNLDIRLETRKGLAGGINLLLDVNNTPRRQSHQLSESQRFFVDIALRMALAQFISAEGTNATLFIDTPEGSLDIAYESRAGEMFAKFIESGYHIIMTANINTSQLLTRLAIRCKKSKMQLLRMTSWTDLSDVQIQEEKLFEKAYSAIEMALVE